MTVDRERTPAVGKRSFFTLIELLVVIAIIAAFLLALNMFRQALLLSSYFLALLPNLDSTNPAYAKILGSIISAVVSIALYIPFWVYLHSSAAKAYCGIGSKGQ